MFSYPCPFCSQRLLAAPERAGKRTICPKCLRPFPIPDPDEEDDLAPSVDYSDRAFVDDADLTHDTPITDLTPRPVQTSARSAVLERPRTVEPVEQSVVSFNQPRLNSLDLASELSMAISMRMLPPPEPHSDIRLPVFTWLIMCATAMILWVIGIVDEAALLPFVGLIGAVQFAFGYFWTAYLAGRHNWVRGVVTVFPPVAIWRLAYPFGRHGHRPLLFVMSGAIFLCLAYFGKPIHSQIQRVFNHYESPKSNYQLPVENPVDELRAAHASHDSPRIMASLIALGTPKDHPKLTAEQCEEITQVVASMLNSKHESVRLGAIDSLMKWNPKLAHDAVRNALASSLVGTRSHAYQYAGEWDDSAMAQLLASRFFNSSEQADIREAMLKIGGRTAEEAMLPLLSDDRPLELMSVIEVLTEVGGSETIVKLRELSEASDSRMVRLEAKRSADQIALRLAATQ